MTASLGMEVEAGRSLGHTGCVHVQTQTTRTKPPPPHHTTRTHTGGAEATVVAVAVLRAPVAGLERY